jgi:hypothetical protein
MWIRNCLFSLSLFSTLPLHVLAAEQSKCAQRESREIRQTQKCSAPTKESRCCRISKWGARCLIDAGALAATAIQYYNCDNVFGAAPTVTNSEYLSRVAEVCGGGAISAMACGTTAVISDVVGLCAALVDCEFLEGKAANVSLAAEGGAFLSSLVAMGGPADARRTFKPRAAIEEDLDVVLDASTAAIIGFGFTTACGIAAKIKACCKKEPAQPCAPKPVCEKESPVRVIQESIKEAPVRVIQESIFEIDVDGVGSPEVDPQAQDSQV